MASLLVLARGLAPVGQMGLATCPGMGLNVRHASNVGGDEPAGGGEAALGEAGGDGVLRPVELLAAVADWVGDDEVAGFQVGLGTAAGVFALGA